MNRRKKVLAAATGLVAAGIFAVGVGAAPAHAAPAAVTGWEQTWIISQRNGQCAFWSADNRLAPIDSVGCSSSTWWYCRVLTWGPAADDQYWNAAGDTYECVDKNLTYMFGESGGAFKMEAPSTDSYIQDEGSTGYNYQKDEYYSNDNFFASGPAGSALGVEGQEPSGYGWFLSGLDPS